MSNFIRKIYNKFIHTALVLASTSVFNIDCYASMAALFEQQFTRVLGTVRHCHQAYPRLYSSSTNTLWSEGHIPKSLQRSETILNDIDQSEVTRSSGKKIHFDSKRSLYYYMYSFGINKVGKSVESGKTDLVPTVKDDQMVAFSNEKKSKE